MPFLLDSHAGPRPSAIFPLPPLWHKQGRPWPLSLPPAPTHQSKERHEAILPTASPPTAGRERRQKHQTGPLRHSPLFFRLRGGVWCFRQQNNSPVKLSDLRFLQIPYQRGRPRREKRHQRALLGQIFRRRCRKGAVWCCRGVKPALATYTSRHRCRAGHLRHAPLAPRTEPGTCGGDHWMPSLLPRKF